MNRETYDLESGETYGLKQRRSVAILANTLLSCLMYKQQPGSTYCRVTL